MQLTGQATRQLRFRLSPRWAVCRASRHHFRAVTDCPDCSCRSVDLVALLAFRHRFFEQLRLLATTGVGSSHRPGPRLSSWWQLRLVISPDRMVRTAGDQHRAYSNRSTTKTRIERQWRI